MPTNRHRLHRALVAILLAGSLAGCVTRAGEVRRIVKASDAVPLVVVTEQGRVAGMQSSHGTAFLGIPFAAAPVGPLRFAPPAPAPAWSGVRAAGTAGPTCPQSFGPDRAEDCLNLNVYAPHDVKVGERLPVMVWLYGGGLTLGSNRQYDGSLLADRQRVIVVVPNYRLGALGFMAHPGLRGTGEGNYGLLDQQAALRWVRGNIAAFGGDPTSVTLFGESAGATSACTQMAMPGSRGLFHRVILESDTCIFPDQSVTMAEAERAGRAMARDLGCDDGPAVAACLRALPVKRLLKAKSGRWGNGGKNSWSPMTGGDVLPITQREAFARGEAAAVPVIMGSNHDEGRLFTNLLALTLAWTSDQRYERAAAKGIRPDVLPAAIGEYAGEAAHSRYRAAAAMITDSHFACPMLTLHRLRAGKAPDFVYEFDDPDAPTALPTIPFAPRQRSFHSAELIYIFGHKLLMADPATWKPAQRVLAERMQDHWGAFARSGNPNGASLPNWPVFDGASPLAFSPGHTGFATDFARKHHCTFWNARGY